jgi:hypothetical protein
VLRVPGQLRIFFAPFFVLANRREAKTFDVTLHVIR